MPLEFLGSYILKSNLVPPDWYNLHKIIMLSTMDDLK